MDLDQAAVIEDRLVRPARQVELITPMEREGIADSGTSRGNIGQAENLPTKRRRGNIVPAAAILGGDDADATRLQNSLDFGKENFKIPDVFDDLIGVDQVEISVVVGQAVAKVRNGNQHAPVSRQGCAAVHDLDAVNFLGSGCPGKLHRPGSVVAAQVADPGVALASDQLKNVAAI
jgi:hypothetical protein